MQKPKNREGVVYSTNPDFEYNDWFPTHVSTPPLERQKLKISLDKNGRAGKMVTLIQGFQGPESELNSLTKELKTHCGTGGSAKNGEILIQGDVRKKVGEFFQKKGVSTKII